MSENFYDYKAALNTVYAGVRVEPGPVIDVNSFYPSRFLVEDPQFNELAEGDKAFMRSLDASRHCMDQGSMDPYMLAELVAMDAEQRERDTIKRAPKPKVMQLKKASNLGCWVDGKLRFQSRDHDNVHAFARGQMENKRNTSVWVAPVGSFIDVKA